LAVTAGYLFIYIDFKKYILADKASFVENYLNEKTKGKIKKLGTNLSSFALF
jgi:hypothetical protein